MTAAESAVYEDPEPEDAETRILAFLNERKEDGVSVITIASIAGCNLPMSVAKAVLARLMADGRARRVIKGGYELWFPPLSSYDKSIEAEIESHERVVEREYDGHRIECPVKGCDSKVGSSAGRGWHCVRHHLREVHGIDDERIEGIINGLKAGKKVSIDDPNPDRLKCQFCGKVCENGGAALAVHERMCRKNPEREKNVMKMRTARYGDKALPLDAPMPAQETGTGGRCRHCGKQMEKRLKNHERMCPKNPERYVPPGTKKHAEGAPKVDRLASHLRKIEDGKVAPPERVGDMDPDGYYPPLRAPPSEPEVLEDLPAEQAAEHLPDFPECEGDACVIGAPSNSIPVARVVETEATVHREADDTAIGQDLAAMFKPEEPKGLEWVDEQCRREQERFLEGVRQRLEPAEDIPRQLRQWLVDELMALTDEAEARGLHVEVTLEWPELRADVIVRKGARNAAFEARKEAFERECSQPLSSAPEIGKAFVKAFKDKGVVL